ncbi:hypothetical protein GCM10027422_23100 [Hymenobacter arcticus]
MGLLDALTNMFTENNPRVFISYDHSEDRRYRDLLCAWNANSAFNFAFERCSPMTAIDSKEARIIKGELIKMLKQAKYLLVIVGEKTHMSRWVRWEIARAKKEDIGLKLIVVKLKKSHTTPYGLLNAGANFAHSFTLEAITKAIKEA